MDGNPASTETEHTGGELDVTSFMDVEGGSAGEGAKDGAVVGTSKDKVPKERELTSVSVTVFPRLSF